jgi:hypothetical protein
MMVSVLSCFASHARVVLVNLMTMRPTLISVIHQLGWALALPCWFDLCLEGYTIILQCLDLAWDAYSWDASLALLVVSVATVLRSDAVAVAS